AGDIMEDKFQIFEPRFNDEEIESEVNNFFQKYKLTPLFTNEHKTGSINITYVDERSVINTTGSNHKTLKEYSNLLTIANDNKSYEESLFKIIYEERSFQGLMKTIKKLMDNIKTIDPSHMFNLWNIVWYNKEVY